MFLLVQPLLDAVANDVTSHASELMSRRTLCHNILTLSLFDRPLGRDAAK